MRSFTLVLLFILTQFSAAQLTTEALLDTIQRTAFSFFWNEANPDNGLIRDRATVNNTSGAPSSIASVGFGLSAIAIGVDHGWVSREAARDRVLTTLKFFWKAPQGPGNSYSGMYGLFYHFLDMSTGRRAWNSELSTIDTALLLAGIIDMKQYFTQDDPKEAEIRAYADSVYYRMNWDLMRNFNPGILLGWMPGTGFSGYGEWVGYNEATIMYILALGSPTYPVDYTAWQRWVEGYSSNYKTQYGYQYVNFPPLFGHQYSHCWIDFRVVNDEWMKARNLDYFENSRRATLAQRAYSIANPGKFVGYSDSLWGITASDSPFGYSARGGPPAQGDDGTLVPTAPISSIPFAPEAVIPVIHKMWNTYRAQLWTKYGFRDAFHLGLNWWDNDVIGIDQGPIIIMIENYRNQSVWNRFMKNPDVQRGLAAAKFISTLGVEHNRTIPEGFGLDQNYPNPFNPATTVSYRVPFESHVRIAVYDMLGREVAQLVNGVQQAGTYTVPFGKDAPLTSGTYLYRMTSGQFSETRKMIVTK